MNKDYLIQTEKIIEVLKQIDKHPELIFSELFSNRNHLLSSFALQDYCKEYMYKIDVFSDTLLTFTGVETLLCEIPSFRDNHKDNLMLIDLKDKTFTLNMTAINNYNSAIKIYQDSLLTEPLTEIRQYYPGYYHFLKEFENFSFKKRFKNALAFMKLNPDSFCYKNNLFRIKDFFSIIFITKKQLDNLYQHIEKVELNAEKQYNEDIKLGVELKKLYIKDVPIQIEKIQKKQEDIADYLRLFGFTEIISEDQIHK